MVRGRRGVGDVQALTFPFLTSAADCTVGAIDPATGDTIAGCGTPGGALPPVQQSMTVTAKAYPTWLYWAAGGIAGLLIVKAVGGR